MRKVYADSDHLPLKELDVSGKLSGGLSKHLVLKAGGSLDTGSTWLSREQPRVQGVWSQLPGRVELGLLKFTFKIRRLFNVSRQIRICITFAGMVFLRLGWFTGSFKETKKG